jgi:hypothetical protein
MSATDEREKAIKKAKTDFSEALALARKVSDSWYRAQALAWVARYAPDSEVMRVAEEAIKEAFHADDSYLRVGACAWAIRALAERDHNKEAAKVIPRLLKEAENISNPVSRLDALFLLWQGAWNLKADKKDDILRPLVSACQAAKSWKAGRTLRDVIAILLSENKDEAQKLIQSMPDSSYKRQAEKVLVAGAPESSRPFFW